MSVVVKYFEEKPVLNLKIVKIPMNVVSSNRDIRALDIFEAIRNDDPFLEVYNPCLGLNIVTKFAPLESKPLEQSYFSIDDFVTFVVRRKYKYETYCEEMVMTFEDPKLAIQHVSDVMKTMDDDPMNSRISLRFYDYAYKAFIRLKKNESLPEKRMMTSLGYVILMVERHYEKDEGFTMIEEDNEDSFVVLTPIFPMLKKEEGSMEICDYWSPFVDLERMPLKDHARNLVEEMKEDVWSQVDVPLKSLVKSGKMFNKILEFGVRGFLRRDCYLFFANVAMEENSYLEDFRKVFSSYYFKENLVYEDVEPAVFPEFGGNLNSEDHFLNSKGFNACKRILCVVGFHFYEIEFCPLLVQIVTKLLYFMKEEMAYHVVYNMIKKSNYGKYFRTTALKDRLLKMALKDTLAVKLPILSKHFDMTKFSLDSLYLSWVDKLFNHALPFDFTLHVLDVFIKKGQKGLVMVILGILKYIESDLLQCTTSSDIYSLCCSRCLKFNSLDEWEIFKHAFGFGISQQSLRDMDARNKDVVKFEDISSQIFRYTRPKLLSPSTVITKEKHWEMLWNWMPFKEKNMTAIKAFSTAQNGYQLQTILSTINEIQGSFVILFLAAPNKLDWNSELDQLRTKEVNEDNNHQIFGVFCAEPFSLKEKSDSSFNTFLFTLSPHDACYRWTKQNDFIVSYKNSMEMGRERQSLSFGAGGDGPGLYIDDDLLYGSSYKCATFGNEPLCHHSDIFTIFKVEIFEFSQKYNSDTTTPISTPKLKNL